MNRDLISSIENMTREVWPPAEVDRIAGWELRATHGYTRRANSANPYPPDPGNVEAAIDTIAAWYERRGLPPIFRFTPVSDAPSLEAALEVRGYTADRGTVVMTAPVTPVEIDIEVTGAPSAAWIAAKDAWSPLPTEHRQAWLDLLARTSAPVGCGIVRRGDDPVAAGHAAVSGDMVALFGLVVDPRYRRQGHGTRLTTGLMAWGASHGAAVAWLQVHAPSNQTAVSVYRRTGFTSLYEYWYRERRPL